MPAPADAGDAAFDPAYRLNQLGRGVEDEEGLEGDAGALGHAPQLGDDVRRRFLGDADIRADVAQHLGQIDAA